MMILMPKQEFGGTVMITIPLRLVIYQKGFILERVTKQKKVISVSTDVLFVVFIRTSHLKNTALIFFKNLPTCSKSII